MSFEKNGWFIRSDKKEQHLVALFINNNFIGFYNNEMPPGSEFLRHYYLYPQLPNYLDIKSTLEIKAITNFENYFKKICANTKNKYNLKEKTIHSTGYFVHNLSYFEHLKEKDLLRIKTEFNIPYEYKNILLSVNFCELEIF